LFWVVINVGVAHEFSGSNIVDIPVQFIHIPSLIKCLKTYYINVAILYSTDDEGGRIMKKFASLLSRQV